LLESKCPRCGSSDIAEITKLTAVELKDHVCYKCGFQFSSKSEDLPAYTNSQVITCYDESLVRPFTGPIPTQGSSLWINKTKWYVTNVEYMMEHNGDEGEAFPMRVYVRVLPVKL
jgi:Zn ribbon nucleic-acid-binding protein